MAKYFVEIEEAVRDLRPGEAITLSYVEGAITVVYKNIVATGKTVKQALDNAVEHHEQLLAFSRGGAKPERDTRRRT